MDANLNLDTRTSPITDRKFGIVHGLNPLEGEDDLATRGKTYTPFASHAALVLLVFFPLVSEKT